MLPSKSSFSGVRRSWTGRRNILPFALGCTNLIVRVAYTHNFSAAGRAKFTATMSHFFTATRAIFGRGRGLTPRGRRERKKRSVRAMGEWEAEEERKGIASQHALPRSKIYQCYILNPNSTVLNSLARESQFLQQDLKNVWPSSPDAQRGELWT